MFQLSSVRVATGERENKWRATWQSRAETRFSLAGHRQSLSHRFPSLVFHKLFSSSPLHLCFPRHGPSYTMRRVALSALLVVAATGVAAEESKPAFKACLSHTPQHSQKTDSASRSIAYSPRLFTLPSSSSSPTTGRRDGHPPKPLRRPPSAARPSATSASGRSRSLNPPSLKATRVSWPRPRLLTTPSQPPSARPLISATSPSLSNTKSSIRRAATAVVVTSSFWRTVSRLQARSSLTRLHGLSCLVPT